jgi:Rieske Fe-S protein
MKSILKIASVILFITMAINCNKNNQERAFYPALDVYINISLPQYTTLQVPGGWAYVAGGLRGILVYAKGGNEFVAYDRNCTYNEANSCGTAEVNADNILVDCLCDGSQYNIFNGAVNTSPATLPLKGYQTSFNSGNNTLRIYN